MIPIKTIIAKVIENASKAKFYHDNRDIFIKLKGIIYTCFQILFYFISIWGFGIFYILL